MNDDNRPNPDEILSRIEAEEEEQESTRGKLRIFFGACAGVGKTYSMLSAAQSALREGRDVTVGVVETHGREDTLKLMGGIPVIPLRSIEYKGTTISEFDIDAALLRKPDLILLDELAHTNAPGSRHPKRWQDVEEMLQAGIDVYTTLNVQHLESLNDVVERITGVTVKETVPDALFDKADEISLIDIPSEELLKRLKEGKVYIAAESKRRAAQNFFKKGNLIALRELALRRTAERVDAQMDDYKQTSGEQNWSGADRILVCIGPDPLSIKLVRTAKRMSSGLKAPWTAVYVENDRHYRLSKEGQDAVERTLRLAERMDGATEVVQGQNAAEEILAYARAHGITKIIVGKAHKARWREVLYGTLADHIMRRSGDIDVYVVTGEEGERSALVAPLWHTRSPLQYYAAAPLVVAVMTALLFPVHHLLNSSTLVLFYLLGVVTCAVRFGRGPSLLATVLAALCFNYFFMQPQFALKAVEDELAITLVALVLSGLIIGSQTSRLRMQAVFARQREENTASLYAITRGLAASRGKTNLAEISASHIAHVFDCEVSVWLPSAENNLERVAPAVIAGVEEEQRVREESAARWAFSHKQAAGLGTETLPSAEGIYLPLIGSEGVVGVIGVTPNAEDVKNFSNERIEMLETFASLTAVAIERANSAEMVEKTMVEAEGERLRNILLSSVSHDLRTPLASITSAASTLLLEGEKITVEYRTELYRLIHEEGARLAQIVTNLLDVTSLEAGSVKLNKELYFIEELVGSALMRVEPLLGKRRIVTRIDPGLPLIRMDGLLIEQILINLLENLADHTPEHTNVTISARVKKPDLHVTISDDGPGIPAGDEEHIFDKFYANRKVYQKIQEGKGGGLGLAICRGIVKAHGGKIWAQNNPESGATFTFTIPLRSKEEG